MDARKEIERFKNEFVSLRNASQEEKKAFDKRFKGFISSKSEDEKKELASSFYENAKRESEKARKLIEYIDIKKKLSNISGAVSMSYIAENYFKKSRSWINQRLNNSTVNKIQASFNSDELKTLSYALDDIGNKMKEAARLIMN